MCFKSLSEPRNLLWWHKWLHLPLCAAIHRWVLQVKNSKGMLGLALSFQTSESQRQDLWGSDPALRTPSLVTHPTRWLDRELWEDTVASLDASAGETHLCSLYCRVWNVCLILCGWDWRRADSFVWYLNGPSVSMACGLRLSFNNTTTISYW